MTKEADSDVVALPRGYHLTKVVGNRLKKNKETVRFQYFGSVGECMEAVRNGSAGRTFINSFELNYYMNQNKFAQLKVQAVPDFDEPTSIGISKSADPLLFSILCKALRSISQTEMNTIILNGTKGQGSTSLLDIVYLHPLGSSAAATAVALLVGGFIFFYYSNRRSEKLRRELEIANRAKTDFVSRMSHDIRTPMNAIIGLTEIARKNSQDKPTTDTLDKINQSSQFLLHLINDILDISRIESDRFVLLPELYKREDFAAFIDSTIAPLAKEKRLTFTYELMEDVPCLFIDKVRFNQIFTNIIGNSIKYTPSGGNIKLSFENQGQLAGKQNVKIVVTDDGTGISKEFLPHVFETFVQESSAHTCVRTDRIHPAERAG